MPPDVQLADIVIPGVGTLSGIRATWTPASDPVPAPPTPPAPNAVVVGGVTLPLAGINPTAETNPAGKGYPGFRGPNQLMAYQAPITVDPCNTWGATALVGVVPGAVGGQVIGVNDRQATGAGPSAVPLGGMLLTGHGTARTALLDALGKTPEGAAVELGTEPPGPVPPVVRPAGPRTIAVYVMDGVGHVAQVPPECTQVRVAFLQAGGLVEWGGDSPATTARDLIAWRSAVPGRQILVSLGGSGGRVDMGTVEADVRRVEQWIPLDGLDWDVEGTTLDVAACVRVSRALAAGRESTWLTSLTPSGGPPVGVYLDAARQCQQAGLLVEFGQQLYDAPVSQAEALAQTQLAVATLGPGSVLVGMMIGQDANHWTLDECRANMASIIQRWPSIGGACLWESSRSGTAEWGTAMAALLPA